MKAPMKKEARVRGEPIDISENTIEEFENNGVIVLRNVVEEYWLSKLATAIEKALVWQGEFAELYSGCHSS